MSEFGIFLEIDAFDKATLRALLDDAARFKAGKLDGRPMAGRMLAMVFEKPSTRTRVSFEVAMRQLGGDTIVLEQSSSQLGRGETIGRYGAGALALRRCDHAAHGPASRRLLADFAEYASTFRSSMRSRPGPIPARSWRTFSLSRSIKAISPSKGAWSLGLGMANNVATLLGPCGGAVRFRLRCAPGVVRHPISVPYPTSCSSWARAEGRLPVSK